jgi:uncharacterized protein with WD repeat
MRYFREFANFTNSGIHSLQALAASASSQKTFFKADRVQIKWNTLGTLALVMTQTEVDKSNKSYYGETQLYLLSAAGNFDSRITLGTYTHTHNTIYLILFDPRR